MHENKSFHTNRPLCFPYGGMLKMEIKEISEPTEKSSICDNILRNLPKWFGNEKAIVDYVNQVGKLPLYAALESEKPIGFVAIKVHNAYTAEVCVMGVLQESHRKGIGTSLVNIAEKYCRANNFKYLTVKTLDSSAVYEPYERTRNFYRKVGFIPLEVFTAFWDEENPCLFLVKHLECTV
jgi:GNAT superfamily N-acetyltransferase